MSNVKVKVNLPDSLKNAAKTSYYVKQAFLAKSINDNAKVLSKAGANIKVNSNRMEVTIGRLTKLGVVDMKPFFMRSSKVKRKKNGGWYLVIPISMSSRGIIKNSGRAVYNRIVKSFSDISPNSSATLSIDGLLKRQYPVDTIDSLQPDIPTNNLTATKKPNGRNTYVAFRTVSDKSSPTSWVLNRNNVNKDNTSANLEHEIGVLIRKRIKQTYG